jgi:hypothetical protein
MLSMLSLCTIGALPPVRLQLVHQPNRSARTPLAPGATAITQSDFRRSCAGLYTAAMKKLEHVQVRSRNLFHGPVLCVP